MAAGLLSRRVKIFGVKGSNCEFSEFFLWGGGWPQDCIP